MSAQLSDVELRVLGVLIEKAFTTPDQYPLTLNSLTLGCNQKTSRAPVTDYDEPTVLDALTSLRDRKLVFRVDQAGARVAKFEHRISQEWELDRSELAILTVLLLRGPQTLGQIRQRSERMFLFADLDDVRTRVESLQERPVEPEVLVQSLPILPGIKETRYAHTLAPVPEQLVTSAEGSLDIGTPAVAGLRESRIEILARKVDDLELELARLRESFESFKAQF